LAAAHPIDRDAHAGLARRSTRRSHGQRFAHARREPIFGSHCITLTTPPDFSSVGQRAIPLRQRKNWREQSERLLSIVSGAASERAGQPPRVDNGLIVLDCFREFGRQHSGVQLAV
jgi:hypothetical protein